MYELGNRKKGWKMLSSGHNCHTHELRAAVVADTRLVQSQASQHPSREGIGACELQPLTEELLTVDGGQGRQPVFSGV